MIGVDHRHLQPIKVLHLEAVYRIGSGAADTHHFDRNRTIS